ncbi:MAG: hypothetical protein L6R35_000785 [Caloplaca aegaea]|nr:MAG: hypothetical protein L6R35_000785 [Caloplaca aegaea]
MSVRPLFIASIGNPSPAYTNTLHSAGHTVLDHLRNWLLLPPFTKSRSGFFSASPDFTLWQSPSLMNVSGKPVATAWRTFLSSLSNPHERNAARLVVVHDELELALGKIKLRDGGSARGHNGLKSVMQALPPGLNFTRVGVGIGRPPTRDSREVAAYVMKKMTSQEVQIMADVAGQKQPVRPQPQGNVVVEKQESGHFRKQEQHKIRSRARIR